MGTVEYGETRKKTTQAGTPLPLSNSAISFYGKSIGGGEGGRGWMEEKRRRSYDGNENGT